ncbi:hypothetical protein CVT25_007333 [Psilocybe cyanescens]|uniref:Uncharacterized protein n=1 Tax=Psilocybe cyanescens TaxID=93625 RepID=A0A409XJB6_PSICY|nr:hypothetical protein CVT25_007333 [Psilocybe cyanescens]
MAVEDCLIGAAVVIVVQGLRCAEEPACFHTRRSAEGPAVVIVVPGLWVVQQVSVLSIECSHPLLDAVQTSRLLGGGSVAGA